MKYDDGGRMGEDLGEKRLLTGPPPRNVPLSAEPAEYWIIVSLSHRILN